MAAARFVYAVGIIAVLTDMAGVALYAVGRVLQPLPFHCGDYGSDVSLPAECRRTAVAIYVVILSVLGGAPGALWRELAV
jgi:hypothetical protein